MWQNLNSVIQKCLSWFKPNSDPTKKETLQKYIKKIAKNHLKGVYTAEGVVRKVRKHGFPLCSYGEYCRHNKSCPKQKISQAPEAFAKFMVIATKPFIELCKIHSGMPLNQIHECIFEYFEKNMSDLFDDLPFIAKGFNYPQLKPFFKCTTEGCTYSVCSDWGHGIDIKEYDEPQ